MARAKAEIFVGLLTGGLDILNADNRRHNAPSVLKYLLPGGLAILNADNRWFDFLSSEARGAGALVSAFGEGGGNDAQLISHTIAGERARIEARFHGRDIAFSLSHTGRHQAVNALSVLLMLEALGVDLETSIASLEDAPTLEGRGKVTEKPFKDGTITIIDESYNANPVSMVATLKSLASANKGIGRKIVVMTDMLELGPDEAAQHAGVSATLEALDIDRVYLAGPLMKNLWDVLPERLRGRYAASAADLTEGLTADLRSGDLIMVKGSNGSKAGMIAKVLLS